MCDCISKFNEHLKQHNTRLSTMFCFSPQAYDSLIIETEIIEKKRGARKSFVTPSYCPFCGVKYERPAPADPVTP